MEYRGERFVVRPLLAVIVAVLIAVVLWSPRPASAMEARDTAASLAGRVFTVAGAFRWTGPRDESGFVTAAVFSDASPAPLRDGGFLFADIEGDRVLKVSPGGRISVVAGGTESEQLGDG